MTQQGFWNEYFSTYIESCVDETTEGQFTNHYKNFVRTEYIQKYWDIRFEEYYKKVSCPILFLPSSEEWENEKIRESFKFFTSFLNTYEIYHIKDAVHAYVWMQQPKVAGEVVKNFISKYR